MKKMMALAAAAIVAVVALAADMASQPWVNKKLDELHTNILDEVKTIAPTGAVTEAYVDQKLLALQEQMRLEMQNAIDILADTNDEHSVEKSMTMQSAASLPLAEYILSKFDNFN